MPNPARAQMTTGKTTDWVSRLCLPAPCQSLVFRYRQNKGGLVKKRLAGGGGEVEMWVQKVAKKVKPFVLTWMELEGSMLSEINQSEKDKHYMVSFIWGI